MVNCLIKIIKYVKTDKLAKVIKQYGNEVDDANTY